MSGDLEVGFKLFEGIVTAVFVAVGEISGHGVIHTFGFVSLKVKSWYAAWQNFEQVVEQDVQQLEQELDGLWFWAVEIIEDVEGA